MKSSRSKSRNRSASRGRRRNSSTGRKSSRQMDNSVMDKSMVVEDKKLKLPQRHLPELDVSCMSEQDFVKAAHDVQASRKRNSSKKPATNRASKSPRKNQSRSRSAKFDMC